MVILPVERRDWFWSLISLRIVGTASFFKFFFIKFKKLLSVKCSWQTTCDLSFFSGMSINRFFAQLAIHSLQIKGLLVGNWKKCKSGYLFFDFEQPIKEHLCFLLGIFAFPFPDASLWVISEKHKYPINQYLREMFVAIAFSLNANI